MTDLTLTEALAEVKHYAPWEQYEFELDTIGFKQSIREAVATILNAAASGALIPRADADLAVALVVERAAKAIKATTYRLGDHPDIRRIMAPQVMWGAGDSCITAIRALAPADALAEVQALRKERDQAREWLGAANNEFGSATWDWPDLWRRIAQLKELSNERWRRASLAEARLAEFEAERDRLREALGLADAALSGANMDMKHVWRKIKTALSEVRADDPLCTCCDGTGITKQTERFCSCEAGLAALAEHEKGKR